MLTSIVGAVSLRAFVSIFTASTTAPSSDTHSAVFDWAEQAWNAGVYGGGRVTTPLLSKLTLVRTDLSA